ncbi:sporulation peptidase YabG, partial [Bacillus mycoides]|uniref:sporulation peptidase YabG n=1 Tax=Bacillus mycoides TaxID=1405 RepID=UPI003CC7CDC6
YTKSKRLVSHFAAYPHSRHFVHALHQLTKKYPSLHHFLIFPPPCHSHFQPLITPPPNFPTSPSPINIHPLHPLYLLPNITFTSFMHPLNLSHLLPNTITPQKPLAPIHTT